MPSDITPVREGNAFFEVEFNLPGSKPLSLGGSLVAFEQAQIDETVHGAASSLIAFHTSSMDYVDRVLKALNADGTPLLRYRYGVGQPQAPMWTPWQLHLLLHYDALAEGIGPNAGHFVRLFTGDILHLLNRATKTTAHRGTVSRIVRAIAERNGVRDLVIEDTAGDGLWMQSYQGDVEFIRQRLLGRARSTRGRGNYLLYVRDNVLHFHPPDFQASVKLINYYTAPHSSLMLSDLSQHKLEIGASGVRLTTHDPYTGQSREIRSDPQKAVRYGNSIPRLDRVSGAERNIQLHLSGNRPEEVENIAQNAYESARSESFQLKVSLEKTDLLRAGDLLQINLDASSAHTSSWSGFYQVVKADHIIAKGAIKSVYILQRGEQVVAKGSSNALASIGVKTIVDEQNAPGIDLNLLETQASNLTRGAGKAVSSKTFVTVQDRNTAPVAPATASFRPPS